MRTTLLISCALISAVGCGGYRNDEAKTTTITSGPLAPERELPRTVSASAESIARGVCEHEQRCGRNKAGCVDATVKQARKELMNWNCSPAATRARLESCIVGFQSVSCDVNLRTDRQALCPTNVVCPNESAKLIDPGPYIEKAMEE